MRLHIPKMGSFILGEARPPAKWVRLFRHPCPSVALFYSKRVQPVHKSAQSPTPKMGSFIPAHPKLCIRCTILHNPPTRFADCAVMKVSPLLRAFINVDSPVSP
jgi:hypothetical protein